MEPQWAPPIGKPQKWAGCSHAGPHLQGNLQGWNCARWHPMTHILRRGNRGIINGRRWVWGGLGGQGDFQRGRGEDTDDYPGLGSRWAGFEYMMMVARQTLKPEVSGS